MNVLCGVLICTIASDVERPLMFMLSDTLSTRKENSVPSIGSNGTSPSTRVSAVTFFSTFAELAGIVNVIVGSARDFNRSSCCADDTHRKRTFPCSAVL